MAQPASCTTGLVIDNLDPQASGLIKVGYFSPGHAQRIEVWARLSMPMAGADCGFWFLPEIDDEVLLAFGRDEREVFVIGSVWNGLSRPPHNATPDSARAVARGLIRTRHGLQLAFEDAAGHERIVIETPGGQRVVLSDGPAGVEIADANGNAVSLAAKGVTVTAASHVAINAVQVELTAGMLTVNAGMSKFSGVVQCDTLTTNSVVSASYTPGAGNIW